MQLGVGLDPERFWCLAIGDAHRIASALGQPDLVHQALQSRPLSVWWGDQANQVGFAHDEHAAVLVQGSTDRLAQPDAAARLLQEYAARGLGVTEMLGGLCAVLHDAVTDTVLCVRDPLGVYPLFYVERADGLAVSPSPELLARSGRAAPAVDRLALAEWVTTSTTPMARTLYEGVARLPPGHALVATAGGVRVFRYWAPPIADVSDRIDDEEALQRFDASFDRAVARVAEGKRAAVFLSGGLDSSLVAASLARHHAALGLAPPLALTLKFPDPVADEERRARSVASALGLPHVVVPLAEAVGGSGLISSGVEASSRLWSPVGNPWMPAYARLAVEARREGCHVAMTGDGGNDVLESPWELAGDLILRGRLIQLLQFITAQQSYYGGRRRDLYRRVIWGRGVAALARPLAHRALIGLAPGHVARARERRADAALPPWALPDQELRIEVVRYRSSQPAPLSFSDLHGHARRRLLDSEFLAIVHESTYLFSRRIAIEVASPYWDADLVALVLGLPARSLQSDGHAKGLARSSLASRIDLDIARQLRPIHVDAILAAALAAEAGPLLSKLGGLPRLSGLGIVSERGALDFVDRRNAHAGRDPRVWRLLCTEAWLQAHSL